MAGLPMSHYLEAPEACSCTWTGLQVCRPEPGSEDVGLALPHMQINWGTLQPAFLQHAY